MVDQMETDTGCLYTDVYHILPSAIHLEQVFSIPGMGNLLITSISNRDYPVVQGILVLIAALIIIINFVVDLLYGRIDPRIRVKD